VFVPGKLFQPVLMFAGNAGAYPSDWKGFTETNLPILNLQFLIKFTAGALYQKLFTDDCNKLEFLFQVGFPA
jgi:hypothetical protein